jgi:hypothetical protein
MPPSTHTTLHCPRCAYDVSAEPSRWNDDASDERAGLTCPLHGICPECGLRFSWALLYRPELAEVPWFVEEKQRASHSLPQHRFRALRTWLAAMLPWVFWKRIAIEVPHDIPRRIWWLAVVLLVVPLALMALYVLWVGVYTFAAPQTPAYLFPYSTVHNAFASQRHAVSELQWCLPQSLLPPRWTPWLTVFLAGSLLYPVTLLCLPWTRARSKVHFHHVWRAWTYSLAPLLAIIIIAFVAKLHDSVVAPVFPLFGSMGTPSWLDPFRQTGSVAASFNIAYADSQLIPVLIVWQFVWWLFTLRSGFRMTD